MRLTDEGGHPAEDRLWLGRSTPGARKASAVSSNLLICVEPPVDLVDDLLSARCPWADKIGIDFPDAQENGLSVKTHAADEPAGVRGARIRLTARRAPYRVSEFFRIAQIPGK
jgi:hypothetical protein